MESKIKTENFLSISNLCEMLLISEATAKNWIKSRKIKPDYVKNSVPYFSEEYANKLLYNIKSNSSNILKSRRNKKYISGSFFYKDYISEYSQNLSTISLLLDFITSNNLTLSDAEIKYIIADCAIQLFIQNKKIDYSDTENSLYNFLNQKVSIHLYDKLLNDLIDDKNIALNFINKYPDLFNKKYIYEKNEDILGLLYISLSNLGNRKSKGVYYTSTKIVKKIINNLANIDLENKKILDPGCGSGNFLLQLPENLHIENIFGNDIDDNAIKITRINIALKFEISDINILYKNFTSKDFLLEKFDKDFDCIIGNPPWGADFSKDKPEKLRKEFITAQNKNIESYDVFIEKSLNCLNKNGVLSFVLPESILTVKTHQTIRNIILRNTSITYLEFLGNIFDNVQCPSIILQLKNTKRELSTLGMEVVDKNRRFRIKKERTITDQNFSFSLNDEEYSIYEKILNCKNNLYLKNNAIFALGLVTGDNKKYITDIKTNNKEIILKGADIEKYKIIKPERYIEFTPEKFQQVAPEKYYRAKEKLFYKFISNKLIFAYDSEQTLSLNSCNILIPRLAGYNIKYIMAILNSRIAQFIFEKRFHSIKVLKSHIEEIPIPICSQERQEELIKYIDKIIKCKENYSELYEIIEEKICELYELNKNEYEIIKK